MGALLMDYILTAYEETGTMPEVPFAVKTIVTTELAAKICAAHGVKMHNVLTGFKFIGEVIKDYEKAGYGTFVLGFEESYGYLKGTYARDKDAVVAAMLICEMTAYYKAKGMTLSDALDALYARYGYCYEANVEIYMEGLDGPALMAEKMNALRNPAPAEIAGCKVVKFGDYKAQTIEDRVSGTVESTNLPKSNVLSFTLDNGDVIVARPSGTEPKIKFYFMLIGKDKADTIAKMEAYRQGLGV
jgi:phosphoglucomutase